MNSKYFLELNGLSIDLLESLSYKSGLSLSLKRNIGEFDKDELINDLFKMSKWYDTNDVLINLPLDYRVKSRESIVNKYDRYYPDHQVRKVFNDVLGFRAYCDNYDDILKIDLDKFKVEDISKGKKNDDGYRGVHVYYQIDNEHYPIEIQFNTLYDRFLNNLLHDYLYKKDISKDVGKKLRFLYEDGKIKDESDFKKELENVLSSCER